MSIQPAAGHLPVVEGLIILVTIANLALIASCLDFSDECCNTNGASSPTRRFTNSFIRPVTHVTLGT